MRSDAQMAGVNPPDSLRLCAGVVGLRLGSPRCCTKRGAAAQSDELRRGGPGAYTLRMPRTHGCTDSFAPFSLGAALPACSIIRSWRWAP